MRPGTAATSLRTAGLWLAIGVAYALAGRFGLSLAFVHESATAIWPPTGIAIAALLVLGPRTWPGVFAGAFVVNVTTGATALPALVIAGGNTLEAVVAAHLVQRHAGGRHAFDTPRGVAGYVLLAGVLATAVAATVGALTLVAFGLAAPEGAPLIWLTWWLGDFGGALLVGPVLVLWANDRSLPAGWRRRAEAAAAVVAVLLIALAIFGGLLDSSRLHHPITFLALPVVVWAAVRLGARDAATLLMLLAAVGAWGTLQGNGPFAAFGPRESLLLLQAFVVSLSLTALVLAAAVAERRRSDLLVRRSRDELESFSYVVSHDLREPLRSVVLYLDMLEDRAGQRLDPEDLALLQQARAGTRRMGQMIEGLLDFARAANPSGRMADVPAEVALDEAVGALRASFEQSGAVLIRGALPVVRADPDRLRQLFQNLLSNAIKFRGPELPRIEVSAEADGDDWSFRVADNGMGMEPARTEEAFRMFRRLATDPPGMGIGLATARRIVLQHGGRIWIESAPGRGTVVRFTVPRQA